jgi:hypothetical protein
MVRAQGSRPSCEQAEAGLAVDAAGVGRGSGQCLGDLVGLVGLSGPAQEARGRESASKVRLKWQRSMKRGGTGVDG